MIVINLFGAPSAGKTTCANYLTWKLKSVFQASTDYVTEAAKEKTWEGNKTALDAQEYIFGLQSYNVALRLNKGVDILITDSPLPLSVLYNRSPVLGEDFNRTVMNVFNSYHNINYFLERVNDYDPVGRWQTEAESDALGDKLKSLLKRLEIKYAVKKGNNEGYEEIFQEIAGICKKLNIIRK